jgi:hypothetical protein
LGKVIIFLFFSSLVRFGVNYCYSELKRGQGVRIVIRNGWIKCEGVVIKMRGENENDKLLQKVRKLSKNGKK